MKIDYYKSFILKFIKNNLIVIIAFVVFSLLTVLYIERTYVDAPFLDGLMQVPTVEKYFKGTLSIQDITKQWGEHRLIGYSLIFLINTVLFGLNMKVEPYIFLLTYFLIGSIIYFFYKKFFVNNLKNFFNICIQISYVSILTIIFSLTHPPAELMTTQFVIGTLFFVISAIFFDKLCLDKGKLYPFLGFLISITIYIVVFSGAYFGGALFSLAACLFIKYIFSDKKKINIPLFASFLLTTFLIIGYFSLTKVNSYDGSGLLGKVIIFLSRSVETFKALLAGISASTLDLNTFMERLKSTEFVVMVNGGILFFLGIYSLYRFIILKIYKRTYLPILLMAYTIGSIFTIRLGRLNGGWQWTMNTWYSFHLYFYLIGILWVLYYDLLKRIDLTSSKLLPNFIGRNKWTVTITAFSLFVIFSAQGISNIFQWRRGPYVFQWLEVRRQAILFPDKESLKTLLWDEQNSLKAIAVLKKYKLSVFRSNKKNIYPGSIIKSAAWNSDGWISREAKAIIVSGKDGVVSFKIFVPPGIFSEIYNNSLKVTFLLNSKVIKIENFNKYTFDNGAVTLNLKIPKNIIHNFEIKTNKSYVPSKYKISKDVRELSVLIYKFNVR